MQTNLLQSTPSICKLIDKDRIACGDGYLSGITFQAFLPHGKYEPRVPRSEENRFGLRRFENKIAIPVCCEILRNLRVAVISSKILIREPQVVLSRSSFI